MITTFEGIPENERRVLVGNYLGRWRGKVPSTEADQAREYVREGFVYMQRMFWQARFDKMDSDSRDMFDWLSKSLLSEDVSYTGIKHSQLLIDHGNHSQLANEIFDKLWKYYAATPDSGLMIEKQTLLRQIFGFFHR